VIYEAIGGESLPLSATGCAVLRHPFCGDTPQRPECFQLPPQAHPCRMQHLAPSIRQPLPAPALISFSRVGTTRPDISGLMWIQSKARAKGCRCAADSKTARFTPTPSRGRALRSTNAVKSTPLREARYARTGQRVTTYSGVSMKGNGAPFPFSTKPEKAKAKGKTMKIGG